ncbi:bacteriorhodopsin [Spirosoma soli]|uniref:Bacteriorhodopsin n=1 Tax=Spirosoma soli TaxID=1770529 RepID=A0ABW5M4U0_9BACT
MELADKFIPTAGVVGILPMITYFFLVVTTYAFLGHFIFALASRTSVGPEHRTSQILTAMIAAVAGLSYYLIQYYYHDLLTELARVTDPNDRQTLIRESYTAIGQYRYMDWAVTTPLLLIKILLMLRIPLHEIKRPLASLLAADFFMILTGYIGEQQMSFDNEILVGPKLIWGAVSTLGYAVIPFVLYQLWKQFAHRALPEEQQAYRLMALTTVTFWGVYPIGYILTVFNIDLNYIHIAFTIADVINKVGVGVVAYLASKTAVERRVPEDAVATAHQLG